MIVIQYLVKFYNKSKLLPQRNLTFPKYTKYRQKSMSMYPLWVGESGFWNDVGLSAHSETPLISLL